MSLPKLLGNVQAMAAGALAINPASDMYNGIHTVIADAVPALNPGDTSEILRLLVGLLIGVLSKFVYGWIDKKFKKKETNEE